MLAKLPSMTLHGVEAFPVTVEVDVSNGLGYFITGQPDDMVRESLSRVAVAIKGLGFHMPRIKISINLSPAHVPKTGAGFDLPIALGILIASDQLCQSEKLAEFVTIGELGLDGAVLPIRGALSIACQAIKDKRTGMLLPAANHNEAALTGGLILHSLHNLKDAIALVASPQSLQSPEIPPPPVVPPPEPLPDFKDVRGQPRVKRALEIAAAGNHNTLLIGPPGVGKTMLAKRLPSILPPMTPEEVLETSRLHNLAGLNLTALIHHRPFRNPHHTASDVAIVGGGSIPMPGEISLAHNGVLFLDELYEFRRSAIETLRQPLEEGKVRIARARQTLEYPADFLFIAAMNPCFCGYYGNRQRPCTCSKRALEYYRQKTGGPLLDRIDLHVEAEQVATTVWSDLPPSNESSATIRKRVINARQLQATRFVDTTSIRCNARMPDQQIETHCTLDAGTRRFLLAKIEHLQLSARAYTRILKVSRTIADLAASPEIQLDHVAEAVSFRCLDRPIERRNQVTWTKS